MSDVLTIPSDASESLPLKELLTLKRSGSDQTLSKSLNACVVKYFDSLCVYVCVRSYRDTLAI